MIFVYLSPKSELKTERWRNTLESKIYQESLIGVDVDEVHSVTEWGSPSNNKIIQLFVPFMCGIFMTLAILIMPFQGREIYVISMEFLAVNRRCLSSRFAHSSKSE